MTVPITPAVSDGIDYVRAERHTRSGHLNMLDASEVASIAREGRFDAAASWIEEHERKYAEGIIFGFEVSEDAIRPSEEGPVARANRANGD